MVIGWVVGVIPVLGHLIAEPTIDPFVEMRGLKVQKGQPNDRGEQQDEYGK